MVRAFSSSGMPSTGNSTSTTGPMMRATRPTAFVTFSVVTVISVTSHIRVGQRVGAAHDFADFLGDLGLPGRVRQPGEVVDEVAGVVRRRLHRAPPGRVLGGGRLEEGVVDTRPHIVRQ